jgi:hypothetical protein
MKLYIGLALGAAAGAVAALAWPKAEESPAPAPPSPGPALPPTLGGPPIPGAPGETLDPTGQLPNLPPQSWPIPGGTYYAGYGYCPPGYALDMRLGVCVPEANAWTRGHCEECDGK